MLSILDPQFSSTHNYKNDEMLRRRRALYEYEVNRVDIFAELMDVVGQHPASTLLDVACGFGDFLIRLRTERKFEGRLVGIDASSGMLQKPIQIALEKNLNIKFESADVHHLPFGDEEFESITCNFALYAFENMPQAITEIHRCLKKGGYFIGAVHGENNRPKWSSYLHKISDMLGLESQPFAWDRVNIQNIDSSLSGFVVKEKKYFETIIRLQNAEPFVDYTDTFRDLRYNPVPTDDQWSQALDLVRSEVNKEIEQNGFFEEISKTGIFIAQKLG